MPEIIMEVDTESLMFDALSYLSERWYGMDQTECIRRAVIQTYYDQKTRDNKRRWFRDNFTLTEEEIAIMKSDGKIAAIKALRLRLGCDLIDAKTLVDFTSDQISKDKG